jgi:4-hydroxybenzoate polyprenyltransferase
MEAAMSGSGCPPRLRGARRWLRAARVTHPFPTLANGLAVVLFAGVAARGQPPLGATAWLLLTMLLIQSAIGAANDAADADLDRAAKPQKPIASGALSRGQAWSVALVTAVAAAAMAAKFGVAAWVLAMLGLACGLAYDLRLKRTVWSVACYLIALPLLPLWVWTALGRFHAGLLWEYPLGVLIGLALYLGNTAPDIDADRVAGVRGLAHLLGQERALRLAWSALGTALLLGTLIGLAGGDQPVWLLLGGGAGALLLGAAIAVSRSRRPDALVRGWGLLIAASLVFALGWLAVAP